MAQMIGSIVGGVLDIGGTAMQAFEEHGKALENYVYYSEQAGLEQLAAADREQAQREEMRRQLGQQVTGVAKSGVGFTGSPLLALGETLRRQELDALALRRQDKQAIEEFQRLAKGQMDYAKYIRRSGGMKIASSGANTTMNIINSRQPSQQKQTKTTNYGTWSGNSPADDAALQIE